MKRIITTVLAITLICSSIVFVPNAAEAKTKRMNRDVTPRLKTIKVSWNKKFGAKKFIVYRLVTKTDGDFGENSFPKKKDFKKCKTVKNKKSFIDKKVKKGKFYSYYIDALNKKGKVIATTWDESLDLVKIGMVTPRVSNLGYGEDYTNSAKKLYIDVMGADSGYWPKKMGTIIYRKAKGAKKFKKIKKAYYKKAGSIDYVDKKVKPGTTYLYKARNFVKKGKKTHYSKYSKILEIGAVNFRAKYKVESLTKSGVYEGKSMTAIIKFSNAIKYNGSTYFYDKTIYRSDSKMGEFEYSMTVKEYSYDNKTWVKKTNKVKLPTNGALYLKVELTPIKEGENKIVYAGSDKTNYFSSYIDSSAGDHYFIEYDGSGSGDTYGGFDLLKQEGDAYEDWD